MDTSAGRIVVCPHCTTSNHVPANKLGAGGKCGRCRQALFKATPVELSASNFDAHARRADIPLLVDFWAPWCGPCRMMSPAFEAAAHELEPSIRLGKLDTQAEQSLAGRYGVQAIPTMILFARGKEIGRQSGAMPTSAIVAWARQTAARTFA